MATEVAELLNPPFNINATVPLNTIQPSPLPVVEASTTTLATLATEASTLRNITLVTRTTIRHLHK